MRALLALLLAGLAATAMTRLGSAQNSRACTIIQALGPSFGSYVWLDDAPNDSIGTLELRCDGIQASQVIRVELGRGRGPSFTPRKMKMGKHRLEYNLYLDAAHTQVWGDGTRGSGIREIRPRAGLTVSLPIYGRIPPGQQVAHGTYRDVVVVSLQF